MASPSSLKRTCENAGLDFTSNDCTSGDKHKNVQTALISDGDIMSGGSQPLYISNPSQPNVIGQTIPISTSMDPALGTNVMASASAVPVHKRRKLTSAEREVKRLMKESKDKQKAHEKARRDDEKAKKDEEKRFKDLEKEDKQKVKEAEKQVKEAEKKKREIERQIREEEKQKKDDEKHEKEKKQLRLNSFFFKPPLAGAQSGQSPKADGEGSISSRRSSIVSLDEMEKLSRSRSTSTSPSKAQASTYENSFPPFFLQSYTQLAPPTLFSRDEKGQQYGNSKIDEILLYDESGVEPLVRAVALNARELFHQATKSRHVCAQTCSVKDVVRTLNGSPTWPIDLTLPNRRINFSSPRDMLKNVPIKYIRFAEDIRPPYIGTCTRHFPFPNVKKLCRKPCSRSLPNTDYDYDSEAEWEEPGEGEDLDSEGEEEIGEDDEGDEMEGFLDDGDTGDGAVGKRRPLMGNLEPVCTGLRWEGVLGEVASDLQQYKLEYLSEYSPLPIDPYSTAYWPSAVGPKTNVTTSYSLASGHMEPPRIPLNVINRNNSMALPSQPKEGKRVAHNNPATSDRLTASRTPKKLVAPELIDNFKNAIQGSDLTKAGLIEVLKKQFPRQSKDAIKETLGLVAERVGSKEADKRWVVKSDTLI